MLPHSNISYFLFLRDVLWLACSAFGGPQVHISLFLDLLVAKRKYLNEDEFLELNALCNILPGPSSSQTIVAIGFQKGGIRLAYLTLIVWCLPSVVLMILMAIFIHFIQTQAISMHFLVYVQPVAVGFVCFSALRITQLVWGTKTTFVLIFITSIVGYYIRSPWVFPLAVIIGGLITSFLRFRNLPKEEQPPIIKINWTGFNLYWGMMVLSWLLAEITGDDFLRLFVNFYRNGSFVFGGGQVLMPVLFTEFVDFKEFLTKEEFLSGYGMAQLVPGPVFSFTAYIGALSIHEQQGTLGQIIAGVASAAGIFLPGTFLIFFVIRMWGELKKYRFIKASLEGIQAANAGLVIAAAVIFLEPQGMSWVNVSLVIGSALALTFTKISQPFLIVLALLAGIIETIIMYYL
ncbi:MAG: chromate efflux transporter [Cytophagales bacterium]|nr:MAG: chromate efflux transporter [Cytophagales bacterium]